MPAGHLVARVFLWNIMDENTNRQKKRVALLSVLSNSALVLSKIIIGLIIGSVSVISEAIHSGVDLMAAVIAWFAVWSSSKPPDSRHSFGHGKYENISGVIEALLIFVAAGWIVMEAVQKLRHPEPLEHVGWGVLVMGVSVVVNIIVSRQLFRIGIATDSVALQADAWHLRTDVWTSFGVMSALAVISVGKLIIPQTNLYWLDPIVAIGVALLIVKAAYDLTVQAGRDLLDSSLPACEEDWIRDYLAKVQAPIQDYHGLRTRKSGGTRYIELHLVMNSEITLEEAHRRGDLVAEGIERQFDGASVIIHLDPYDDDKVKSIV